MGLCQPQEDGEAGEREEEPRLPGGIAGGLEVEQRRAGPETVLTPGACSPEGPAETPEVLKAQVLSRPGSAETQAAESSQGEVSLGHLASP